MKNCESVRTGNFDHAKVLLVAGHSRIHSMPLTGFDFANYFLLGPHLPILSATLTNLCAVVLNLIKTRVFAFFFRIRVR